MTLNAPASAAPSGQPHPTYREAGVAAVAAALADFMGDAATEAPPTTGAVAREAA